MTPLEEPSDLPEMMLRYQFLKRASPFATLPPGAALNLAQRLITRDIAADAMILTEGEPGDECYLILEGEVAVFSSAGAERELEHGRMGPGELFGEIALLSGKSQTACVRATSDCRLLVLGRADLKQTMAANRHFALGVLELIRFRDRPRRVPGILAFPQTTHDAERIVILKDPVRRSYFRLSADGWNLWQAIDGELSVRDLIVRQHAATGRFEPLRVTDLLQRLAVAGFAETICLPQAEGLMRPPLWLRIAARSTRFFTWNTVLTGCDGWISRLYAGGVWVLFTPLVLTLFAALAAAGLVAFIFALFDERLALATPDLGGTLLGFFYFAFIVSTVLHEAGHAFTTKFFGGEVDRIGVGWFWFGPVAFVNTSDMWTMGRWPRIAVDLAGLAVNAICAGFAVFAALVIARGPWAAVLWQFALASWWMVLLNLNPLFEYDGFYALADWLDRPNLRSQAFAIVWRPSKWRRCRLELIYAVAGLVFVAGMGVLAIDTYRTLLEPWIATLISEQIAAAGAWVIALTFVLITVLQFVPALRERLIRSPAPARVQA